MKYIAVFIPFLATLFAALPTIQYVQSDALSGKVFSINEDTTKLVLIKGGTFMMGSPTTDIGRAGGNVETLHSATVSDFYISKYEVTIEEYEKYCKATGTKMPKYVSKEASDKQLPITWISQYDARLYCNWLSKQTGKKYRLPTEAEWEYACRAGTNTTFNVGNSITTDQANYNGETPYNGSPKGIDRKKLLPVGSFSANKWGLYDMHGNAYEWCQDIFNPEFYVSVEASQPNAMYNKGNRGSVIRGGSYLNGAIRSRCASRENSTAAQINIGFRVVRDL
jgi:formylglycine-generating enzyme